MTQALSTQQRRVLRKKRERGRRPWRRSRRAGAPRRASRPASDSAHERRADARRRKAHASEKIPPAWALVCRCGATSSSARRTTPTATGSVFCWLLFVLFLFAV